MNWGHDDVHILLKGVTESAPGGGRGILLGVTKKKVLDDGVVGIHIVIRGREWVICRWGDGIGNHSWVYQRGQWGGVSWGCDTVNEGLKT